MDKPLSKPDFGRLRRLSWLAIAAGLVVFGLSAWWMGVLRQPEVATVVLAVAFGAVVYSAIFYFGALFFEGSLQTYLMRDETVIKGDNVEMVTHTDASGDAETDRWVKAYVFARNTFGLSVIPLLILGFLYFFS